MKTNNSVSIINKWVYRWDTQEYLLLVSDKDNIIMLNLDCLEKGCMLCFDNIFRLLYYFDFVKVLPFLFVDIEDWDESRKQELLIV